MEGAVRRWSQVTSVKVSAALGGHTLTKTGSIPCQTHLKGPADLKLTEIRWIMSCIWVNSSIYVLYQSRISIGKLPRN